MSGPLFGWLVSYPRSGNTWLRFLIESLTHGGRPVDIGAVELSSPVASWSEFEEHFGVEAGDFTDEEIEAARPMLYEAIARNFDGPLILRKVHDCCWSNSAGLRVFPPELSRGAVYIARDPRDVAVSYADFAGVDLETAITRMGDHQMSFAKSRFRSPQLPQPLGSWSEHVLSWLDHAEMPIHLLRYEDLLADPANQLAKVAEFLGLPSEAAGQAASTVTFRALRAQEEEHGFRERPPNCKHFFRKGGAGGWHSALSAEQANRVLREHGAVMARLGYC